MKSKVRARIEHVFGAQENAPGGRLVRSIGIVCQRRIKNASAGRNNSTSRLTA
jgi:hypothetical protein